MGYTFLALANFQKAFDVDNDDFSDLPKNKNFSIAPRFFYYPDSTTTIMLGHSFGKAGIIGGDMHVIDGHPGNNHL